MACVYGDWTSTTTTTPMAFTSATDTTGTFVIVVDASEYPAIDVNDVACKEEPEEERERYFGLVQLPPARRILRKRRPAQRQSEYG